MPHFLAASLSHARQMRPLVIPLALQMCVLGAALTSAHGRPSSGEPVEIAVEIEHDTAIEVQRPVAARPAKVQERAYVHNVTRLDLTTLEPAAFGDWDEAQK